MGHILELNGAKLKILGHMPPADMPGRMRHYDKTKTWSIILSIHIIYRNNGQRLFSYMYEDWL